MILFYDSEQKINKTQMQEKVPEVKIFYLTLKQNALSFSQSGPGEVRHVQFQSNGPQKYFEKNSEHPREMSFLEMHKKPSIKRYPCDISKKNEMNWRNTDG